MPERNKSCVSKLTIVVPETSVVISAKSPNNFTIEPCNDNSLDPIVFHCYGRFTHIQYEYNFIKLIILQVASKIHQRRSGLILEYYYRPKAVCVTTSLPALPYSYEVVTSILQGVVFLRFLTNTVGSNIFCPVICLNSSQKV